MYMYSTFMAIILHATQVDSVLNRSYTHVQWLIGSNDYKYLL